MSNWGVDRFWAWFLVSFVPLGVSLLLAEKHGCGWEGYVLYPLIALLVTWFFFGPCVDLYRYLSTRASEDYVDAQALDTWKREYQELLDKYWGLKDRVGVLENRVAALDKKKRK